MEFNLVLNSVIAPAMTALLTAVVLTKVLRGLNDRCVGTAAVAAAIWTGFILSFETPWPVTSSWMWPIWSVAAVGCMYVLCAPEQQRKIGGLQTFATSAALAVACAVVAYPMLSKLVPRIWTANDQLLAVLVMMAASLPAFAAGIYVDGRQTAIRHCPALIVWAAGGSLVLMQMGTARGAQTLGFAVASLSAVYLLALWQPRFSWVHGVTSILTGLLAVTSLQQYGYGDETPVWPLLALLLPPVLHAIWTRFCSRQNRPMLDLVALASLSAAPLALTVWLLKSAVADDPYGYGGYGG